MGKRTKKPIGSRGTDRFACDIKIQVTTNLRDAYSEPLGFALLRRS
jgi:hypothetical protein